MQRCCEQLFHCDVVICVSFQVGKQVDKQVDMSLWLCSLVSMNSVCMYTHHLHTHFSLPGQRANRGVGVVVEIERMQRKPLINHLHKQIRELILGLRVELAQCF